MKLVPVSLALFYSYQHPKLRVWTQVRTDGGPFEGLLEFPGGGIEVGESPIEAAVREVEEEVGIKVPQGLGRYMGTYLNEYSSRKILLYVHLFPAVADLTDKGHWLEIEKELLSSSYVGKIPKPNHQIIDDLFQYLYDEAP
jgi:8-oxo-dGTP diphosphatase